MNNSLFSRPMISLSRFGPGSERPKRLFFYRVNLLLPPICDTLRLK